ncbi:plasmolipin [Electrophorus electricus]|uniref:Plasmolipin n=1 Tax=Electrophorus electricus TaxID=8005 RepID=A0A4W4G3I1_ELEEL|nr:plasmolipin [Electrophorus electricus]
MADFPGKVNTETSSPQPQTGLRQHMNISMDFVFVKTIPGILMLVEIVTGMLVWALISSAAYQLVPAFGWVLFVSVTLWILTIVLFVILFLGVYQNVSFVPWALALMVFYTAATILYLTAFLANAFSVPVYMFGYNFDRMVAAAFFGIVVTLTYGASAFFAYTDWRGDGGNAATSTVPV